jgi:D-erythronate 2-dehydrogenase
VSRIVVTGAFGNLGRRVLFELKARGHHVSALDLDTPANRKAAKRATGNCDEVHWGDIREVDWAAALAGGDAIIHLAAILPPLTERAPALAQAINLDASMKIIDAIEKRDKPPHLIFPSSLTVYGYPSSKQLKRVEDEVRPSDNYTRHKIAVERRLATSDIPWTVLRVGVSVDGNIPPTEQEMVRRQFATSQDNPVHYVHPADVALAAVNTLNNPEALQKILLIGGGANCLVTQYDLLSAPLAALGVTLPRSFLGDQPYYTHWMDTADSQRILRFQRHSFDDFRKELSKSIGRWRFLSAPLAPLVLWGLRRSLREPRRS